MVTEKQLRAETRLRSMNALIEESIWKIHKAIPGGSVLITLLSNLISMRVLSGALKHDIKLIGDEK